tara:strand:- start:441 stop:1151 length:711 start_codon:yes stop_codon:yes gene_type:complete
MNRLREIQEQLGNLFSLEGMTNFNFDKKVELNADLKERIEEASFGKMIHHPLLVVVPMTDNPILITQYNLQYEAKVLQVQEAIEQNNIHGFIYLHERPYRHDALINAYAEWWIPDSDLEYWDVIVSAWIDSENIYANLSSWKSLLTEQYANPHLMMDEEEKAFFDSLPDEITIFRGGIDDKGFSWTLDKDKANWFANRLNQNEEVFEKTINKNNALAYLNGRGESEIIYIPEKEEA